MSPHPLHRDLAPTRFAAILAVALVALVAGLAGVGSAGAAAPCWKVLINDWFDGRIDKVYAPACYREAIKHLPRDVRDYASAEEDINRAFQASLVKKTRSGTITASVPPTPPPTTVEGSTGGSTTGGTTGDGNAGSGTTSGGSKPSPPTSPPKPEPPPEPPTETVAQPGPPGGRDGGGGILGTVSPSNADSVPLPLLILAGLALLLLAAAAVSFVTRHLNERRVPSGAPRPPEPPLE